MFEKIFNVEKVESSANYALFAGVFFTIISFITSYLLFKNTAGFVGVGTILFTVILSLPIVFRFFESTRVNDPTFFSKMKALFGFYIYFFIGSFVVFFLISLMVPSQVLSADQLFGKEDKSILPQKLGLPPPPVQESALTVGIFKNNLYVMTIAFILSLLYGAGSLFLLTLNASIFASALSFVIIQTGTGVGSFPLFSLFACNMGIMFFHMLPEVIAYFFAAIGGGILSVAVMKEKLFSKEFFQTFKYSIIMFIAAIVVLIVAAIIEVYISRDLIGAGTCSESTIGVLVATGIVIIAAILLEIYRKRRSRQQTLYTNAS